MLTDSGWPLRLVLTTVLTTIVPDPQGYGRIVRDERGRIERIVEERDASGDERSITEINSGIYALDLSPLFPSLGQLATDNAQGEYYLTDLVGMYRRSGAVVETLCAEDATELRGVNNRVDLSDLAAVFLEKAIVAAAEDRLESGIEHWDGDESAGRCDAGPIRATAIRNYTGLDEAESCRLNPRGGFSA